VNTVHCPRCDAVNEVGSRDGFIACQHCGHEFEAVEPVPAMLFERRYCDTNAREMREAELRNERHKVKQREAMKLQQGKSEGTAARRRMMWSDAEDEFLVAFMSSCSYLELALALKRTVRGVANRVLFHRRGSDVYLDRIKEQYDEAAAANIVTMPEALKEAA
jgi:hypothetical protein